MTESTEEPGALCRSMEQVPRPAHDGFAIPALVNFLDGALDCRRDDIFGGVGKFTLELTHIKEDRMPVAITSRLSCSFRHENDFLVH